MKRFFLPALFLLAAPLLLFAKDYKQVTFPTENAGPVIFDHDVHVGKLANDCTVCHNSLYKIGTKNSTATMADMEQGKSCGKCHNKVALPAAGNGRMVRHGKRVGEERPRPYHGV